MFRQYLGFSDGYGIVYGSLFPINTWGHFQSHRARNSVSVGLGNARSSIVRHCIPSVTPTLLRLMLDPREANYG